jgi:hypothetical protein
MTQAEKDRSQRSIRLYRFGERGNLGVVLKGQIVLYSFSCFDKRRYRAFHQAFRE